VLEEVGGLGVELDVAAFGADDGGRGRHSAGFLVGRGVGDEKHTGLMPVAFFAAALGTVFQDEGFEQIRLSRFAPLALDIGGSVPTASAVG
jgi:hypothetical protein